MWEAQSMSRWKPRDAELKGAQRRHKDEHLGKDNDEQVAGAGADHMGGKHQEVRPDDTRKSQDINTDSHIFVSLKVKRL